MTYNFDIDRWYEMRSAGLKSRLESGELDQLEYERELADLERRYEELQDRLDGSYAIPEAPEGA